MINIFFIWNNTHYPTLRIINITLLPQNITDMYDKLEGMVDEELSEDLLLQAKQMGFSDKQIGKAVQCTELAVRALREKHSK